MSEMSQGVLANVFCSERILWLLSDGTSCSKIYWEMNKKLCLPWTGPIHTLYYVFPKVFLREVFLLSWCILILQCPNLTFQLSGFHSLLLAFPLSFSLSLSLSLSFSESKHLIFSTEQMWFSSDLCYHKIFLNMKGIIAVNYNFVSFFVLWVWFSFFPGYKSSCICNEDLNSTLHHYSYSL